MPATEKHSPNSSWRLFSLCFGLGRIRRTAARALGRVQTGVFTASPSRRLQAQQRAYPSADGVGGGLPLGEAHPEGHGPTRDRGT